MGHFMLSAAELFAQQAKSVLALLAPKDVTETRLRVGRVSCAASGRPPGVSTVRASRRGHDADVILARGSQYSTQPASASHTFSTKLQLGKKEKRWILTFAECLQAEILLPYWLAKARRLGIPTVYFLR